MDPRGGYKSDLSLEEKIMMALVRAAELFKRQSSAIFRNYGLTFAQYNVLRVLDASEKGQNTMSNVSRIMLVSGANITGIAKRLEKGGFLLRKDHPQDERVTLLEITPKGRKTLKNISGEKDRQIKAYLSGFAPEDKAALLAALKSLRQKRPG